MGLAVTVLAVTSLTLIRGTGLFLLGPPPSFAEQLLWAVAVGLPLIWRRRFPVATTLVISVAFVAAQARSAPETRVTTGVLFTAIYTLGAWGPDRRLARRIRIGVIAAMFGWIGFWYSVNLGSVLADPPPDAFADAVGPIPPLIAAVLSDMLLNILFFGFAYFFGEIAWLAARREHELQAQADELRRSQAEVRAHAVVGERVRIARELHDVVAHHVSVMGVQAAACRRVLDRDPAKARTALAAVEESARTAVDELRRMLGVLRARDHEPGTVDSPAGISRVTTVVERARETGLRATLGVYGDPVPISDSISQAAYRTVQEAVTNTLKHAGAATILDVRIRYLTHEVEVDVTDDGRSSSTMNADGVGLVGMRERVAAHGGTLEVGPRAAGGWRVRARFPLPLTERQAA
ncbi:histidine kinase, dimerisation and phosphoacceptor region [Salinispora tropica CNB-440]|uniref:histidine kinase n=1 Tax=Salinispora tropica (strain ATCC BAA-916 / DSM 44818 / JCM 13857 / NBRC 105044 / CNB-440) TaxID=369723 RepID=A4X5W0_SALTO|nr:histidine kinase, dimerisation and phosphoacceptor region [Salinispora tropica CNB-440]